MEWVVLRIDTSLLVFFFFFCSESRISWISPSTKTSPAFLSNVLELKGFSDFQYYTLLEPYSLSSFKYPYSQPQVHVTERWIEKVQLSSSRSCSFSMPVDLTPAFLFFFLFAAMWIWFFLSLVSSTGETFLPVISDVTGGSIHVLHLQGSFLKRLTADMFFPSHF